MKPKAHTITNVMSIRTTLQCLLPVTRSMALEFDIWSAEKNGVALV